MSRLPAICRSRSASRIVGVATENRSDNSFTLGNRSPGSSACFGSARALAAQAARTMMRAASDQVASKGRFNQPSNSITDLFSLRDARLQVNCRRINDAPARPHTQSLRFAATAADVGHCHSSATGVRLGSTIPIQPAHGHVRSRQLRKCQFALEVQADELTICRSRSQIPGVSYGGGHRNGWSTSRSKVGRRSLFVSRGASTDFSTHPSKPRATSSTLRRAPAPLGRARALMCSTS